MVKYPEAIYREEPLIEIPRIHYPVSAMIVSSKILIVNIFL